LLKSMIREVAFDWLSAHGYDTQHPLEPYQLESKRAFFAAEAEARRRYDALESRVKLQLPRMLDEKYRDRPVLGRVHIYEAINELATIIDPLDPYLGALTQLTHQLQLVQIMEDDGLDETMILCGLIHDLGKLLIKYGDEDPIHVEAGGKKAPLSGAPGGGLMKCTFRWDHGDFAYLRLKDHASPEVAWIVRHHSIDPAACEPYMDDYDRQNIDRLIRFMQYDDHKDMYAVPRKGLAHYRPLLERAFPDPIVI
jgi:hypothetical protein